MSPVESSHWRVDPPFVDQGPTFPVTLLWDEESFTQLAGLEPVAWQTPWSEVRELALMRHRRGYVLSATIGGVRYRWHGGDPTSNDELRDMVLAHQGREVRRRHGLTWLVGVAVVAASFGGLIGERRFDVATNPEVRALDAINLSVGDAGPAWSATTQSDLSYLMGTPGQVVTPVTTTTSPSSVAAKEVNFATAEFQHCLGVTNAADRIYGAAGQQPAYQVSSPILTTADEGGIQVGSIAQYYDSTTMVQRDTAEMTRPHFGACFAQSNATLVDSVVNSTLESALGVHNHPPVTFVKGWRAGGYASLSLRAQGISRLTLISDELTSGHYEVTVMALATSPQRALPVIDQLVNTEMSKVAAGGSASA